MKEPIKAALPYIVIPMVVGFFFGFNWAVVTFIVLAGGALYLYE